MDGPVAAGVILKAADTGRILVLQRGLDDKDPASGMIEAPGGHLEDGEHPLQGAMREFCEEVGHKVPDSARLADQWDSANGVYRTHVMVVPSEDDIDINLPHDDRHIPNPDDPDGDKIEVVFWVDPDQLRANPMVRTEMRGTRWQRIEAAGAQTKVHVIATPASLHYRRSFNATERCPTCTHDLDGFCEILMMRVAPDMVCDHWDPRQEKAWTVRAGRAGSKAIRYEDVGDGTPVVFHTPAGDIDATIELYKDGVYGIDPGGGVAYLASADELDLKAREVKYSPGQARDEHGRFGDSAGTAVAQRTVVAPEHLDRLLGSWAEADQPVEMQHVQVSGAGNENLFATSSRGLPREAMPVVPSTGDAVDRFKETLADRGVGSRTEQVDPRTLTATQGQLDGQKVGYLYQRLKDSGGSDQRVTVVDRDGNILDGHHRWAANAAYAVTHPGHKMTVLRADTSIDHLMRVGHEFSRSNGIGSRAFGEYGDHPKPEPKGLRFASDTDDDREFKADRPHHSRSQYREPGGAFGKEPKPPDRPFRDPQKDPGDPRPEGTPRKRGGWPVAHSGFIAQHPEAEDWVRQGDTIHRFPDDGHVEVSHLDGTWTQFHPKPDGKLHVTRRYVPPTPEELAQQPGQPAKPGQGATVTAAIKPKAKVRWDPEFTSEALEAKSDAPYYVRELAKPDKDGNKFVVVNHEGTVKASFGSHAAALSYQRALMVNVPGAATAADRVHGHTPAAVSRHGSNPSNKAAAAEVEAKAEPPYYIRELPKPDKDGNRFVVVNSQGVIKAHFPSRAAARSYQQALYARVPGAPRAAERRQGDTPGAVSRVGRKPPTKKGLPFVQLKDSDDEPRDERGRWTTGGGESVPAAPWVGRPPDRERPLGREVADGPGIERTWVVRPGDWRTGGGSALRPLGDISGVHQTGPELLGRVQTFIDAYHPIDTRTQRAVAAESISAAAQQLNAQRAPTGPMPPGEERQRAEQVHSALARLEAEGYTTQAVYGARDLTTGKIVAGRYTPDRNAAQDRNILEPFQKQLDKVPADRQCIITAGLTGAGKTTALNQFGSQLGYQPGGSNFATLNADDVKEQLLRSGMGLAVPGLSPLETATLVHEESSDLNKEMFKMALGQGKNVVLDITMNNPPPKVQEKYLSRLKAAGYKVTVMMVSTTAADSLKSAQQRWAKAENRWLLKQDEMGGRYVPDEIITSAARPGDGLGPGQRSEAQDTFWKLVGSGAIDRGIMMDRTGGGATAPREVFDSAKGDRVPDGPYPSGTQSQNPAH